MKLFKKAKRGFTLVELVVVIAVIAILAAVSVGAYFGITESANSSRLEQEARSVHTNIQLVAMNQDDNSNLTREGLYINDLDTFETKMESYSGFHYDIVAQEPSVVNNPTLYFCNETGVSSENIVNQRFNTFKYYNPEVANKRASVYIPTGEITIEKNIDFSTNEIEPIITSVTLGKTNGESLETGTVNVFVNETIELGVEVIANDDMFKGYNLIIESGQEHAILNSNTLTLGSEPGIVVIRATSKFDDTKYSSLTVISSDILINTITTIVGKSELLVNESTTISTEIDPINATEEFYYEYNEELIEISNNGNITALKSGTVTINTKVGNEIKATNTISILEENFEAQVSKTTLLQGESVQIETSFTNVLELRRNVSFRLENLNEDSISVNEEGVVEALKGTSTPVNVIIEATDLNISRTLSFIVTPLVTEINLSDNVYHIDLKHNERYQLVPIVLPEGASTDVQYTSSDSNYVTVSDTGEIFGKEITLNNITITISSTDGSGVKRNITVSVSPVHISSIEISRGNIPTTIDVESTETYVAEISNITPDVHDDDINLITWHSKDENILKVNGGVVTPIKSGTTSIYASSPNGNVVSGDIEITVTHIKDIYFRSVEWWNDHDVNMNIIAYDLNGSVLPSHNYKDGIPMEEQTNDYFKLINTKFWKSSIDIDLTSEIQIMRISKDGTTRHNETRNIHVNEFNFSSNENTVYLSLEGADNQEYIYNFGIYDPIKDVYLKTSMSNWTEADEDYKFNYDGTNYVLNAYLESECRFGLHIQDFGYYGPDNGLTGYNTIGYSDTNNIVLNYKDAGTYTITLTKNGEMSFELAKDSSPLKALYLKTNPFWASDNARFAMYLYGVGVSEHWESMVAVNGETNMYVGYFNPNFNYTNVIFCRMNPNNPENSFTTDGENHPLWNQTEDLTLPRDDKNAFVLHISSFAKDQNKDLNWKTFSEAKDSVTSLSNGYYYFGSRFNWTIASYTNQNIDSFKIDNYHNDTEDKLTLNVSKGEKFQILKFENDSIIMYGCYHLDTGTDNSNITKDGNDFVANNDSSITIYVRRNDGRYWVG